MFRINRITEFPALRLIELNENDNYSVQTIPNEFKINTKNAKISGFFETYLDSGEPLRLPCVIEIGTTLPRMVVEYCGHTFNIF